jgi:predicted Zn-dependent peptidase
MADIEAIRREDCVAFFGTYYAPNNATLWAVGDLDPARALSMLTERYGDIPRGPAVPAPIGGEPKQRGERRSRVRFPSHTQALAVAWKAPAGSSPDSVVLDVIQYALSAGEGGRLVRKLVYEKMLAASIYIDFSWKADPGLFTFLAEMPPKVAAERTLAVVDAELEKVATRGLTDEELSRAQGQLRSQVLRELATNNGRAHTLGTHELLLGTWKTALQMPERYAAVTNDEVRRVAREVFSQERRTVVTLVPGPAEEGAHG